MASYYRESWRAHPARFGVVALAGLASAALLGTAVGAISSLHLAAGAAVVVVAGPALGYVLYRSLPFAHVRNSALTCALGVAAGGVAAWAAAVAWLYRRTVVAGAEHTLLCLAPDCLAWALPRVSPRGILTETWQVPASYPWLWALGFLVLVIPALYGAWRGARARVFCEGCGRPADEVLRLVCQPIDDPAVFRGGLEAEHYDLLLKLRPGDPRDERFSRLTLEDCSRCETHSYLSIETVGPRGKVTPVLRRLALWRDVFGELERRTVGEWSQAHAELVDP